ncbi:hypothetical protein [Lysobacter gummosus]|uniref:hypothetical protein n=1 Tax=Lysobacter gummosus TaxID=262324 RepID=UPI003631EA11
MLSRSPSARVPSTVREHFYRHSRERGNDGMASDARICPDLALGEIRPESKPVAPQSRPTSRIPTRRHRLASDLSRPESRR